MSVLVMVIIGVVLLILIMMMVGIYNRLVRGKNQYANAFAQIDVQLKRRYDLIPNLVETAKGYAKHEKETLDAVVKARNTALSALESAGGKIGDPGAMQALGDAEAGLLGALGKLNVVVEAYPDLKANTSMEQLMEELSSTENKVAFSRQAYNDAIMSFNIARASFPAVMFAGMFGFTEVGQLDIRFEAGGREAPKVEF
ncbi:MAG: LemA family protein [Planctomycetes bacterium]|nr:LemA family protein [Planctomycetota bacterium]